METVLKNFGYYKYSESSIKKQNINLWYIINNYIVNDYLTFKEKFYLFDNKIITVPLCNCGNNVKFIDMKNGFREFCSRGCMFNNKDVKEKRKQTCIKKYGVDNPSKSIDSKDKVKKTNLEKFGVEYPLQSKEILNKSKEVFLKNYGVDNPSKVRKIREKAEQTNLLKFGFKHAAQNGNVKEKEKEIFLKNYGVDNPSKVKKIREKAEQTNLLKFGVKHALQNIEIKKKSLLNKNKYVNYELKVQKIYKRVFEQCELKINDSNNDLLEKNGRVFKIQCRLCDNEFDINDQLFRKRKKANDIICINCNNKAKSYSLSEKEILEYIKSIYSGEIIENYRDKLEIDIFLPQLNLGIEYNGLYWHSELFKDKDYHFNKHIYFESKNINIFSIWEDNWLNNKDIIKSMICNKLKLNINKIYGRKTIIKIVDDNSLIRKFLDDNHIQGFVGSSIKIGLYYDDELVSLMTFGKKRKFMNQKNIQNQYELLRFCNKKYMSIVGGASKLFNFFIKNYKPIEILSYSDNSYSNGNIYNLLNFKFINDTINYYWFKDKKKYHRYNFRKDKLVSLGYDINKTEVEIMHELKYSRIFDSGISKWVYTT